MLLSLAATMVPQQPHALGKVGIVGGDHPTDATGGDVFASCTEYADIAQGTGRAPLVATPQCVGAVLDEQQTVLSSHIEHRVEIGRVPVHVQWDDGSRSFGQCR